MARSELIYNYLSDLEVYLSRVSEVQAKEVVKEIESHIFDSLPLQPEPEDEAIRIILGRLGTPRELAAGYIEHLTDGAEPPKGLKRLARVKKQVGWSMYLLICFMGYLTGSLSLAIAIIKLVNPTSFNVWIAEHGDSIILSTSQANLESQHISVFMLIPIAVSIGVATIYLTFRISRVLKLHL